MESLIYSLKPEVAISLGVSSTVLGGSSVNFITNPYINKADRTTSLALGLSSTMIGATFTGPSMEYINNLNEVKLYIQSLSREELEELSQELNLINEKIEMMEDIKTQTIGQFDETYNEIEQIKKHSIWDR